MIRAKIIFPSAIFLFMSLTGMAQPDSSRLYLGLDMFKSFPIVFDRGYVLEPSLILKIKNQFNIDLVAGFNDITKERFYKNAEYENKGHYFKAGIGLSMLGKVRKFNEFNLTASVIFSEFTETANIRFSGPYYGDLLAAEKQHNQLAALELQPNYWLPLSDRLSFNFQIRLVAILNKPNEKEFPAYYVPGVGYVRPLSRDDGDDAVMYAAGLSVRLVYKLIKF